MRAPTTGRGPSSSTWPMRGPGLIAGALVDHGCGIEVVRLDRGDPLPDHRDVAGLVVMGGPMGVHDVDDHPWLVPERALHGGGGHRRPPRPRRLPGCPAAGCWPWVPRSPRATASGDRDRPGGAHRRRSAGPGARPRVRRSGRHRAGLCALAQRHLLPSRRGGPPGRHPGHPPPGLPVGCDGLRVAIPCRGRPGLGRGVAAPPAGRGGPGRRRSGRGGGCRSAGAPAFRGRWRRAPGPGPDAVPDRHQPPG